MKLIELDNAQFDLFAKQHPLNNYCQTSKYALVMSGFGYNYDYIGMVDDQNRILAASMILTKKLKGSAKYGYAPKGFLVNYYSSELLREFLTLLTQYYKKRDFVFIKFNPEIIIGETDLKNKFSMSYNGNVRLIDDLKSYNVKRRLELKEFDLMMPKFNAYIDLKQYSIMTPIRNYRKKIRNCEKKGMYLTLGDSKDLNIFYNMNKSKLLKPLNYYQNLYNTFNKDNAIDLILIKLDFQKYLNFARLKYDNEERYNQQLTYALQLQPGERKIISRKMQSDVRLENYKKQIIVSTAELKKHSEVYVAGALVMKHKNRIIIMDSVYDEEFKNENSNHFLHHAIFERYKEYFSYCDLGGVTGNFEETSPYHGLNMFKANFNAKLYESIGEFDLLCNERMFKKLIKTSFIEDEFNINKNIEQ